MCRWLAWLSVVMGTAIVAEAAEPSTGDRDTLARELAPFFRPPAALANDLGKYRSPLKFEDGSPVASPADWARRRREILATWHGLMGQWPPIIEQPKLELQAEERVEGYTRRRARVEVAADVMANDGYLLVPDGKGPFPAVLVVFYDAATGVGLARPETRADFGSQLARRGFVALSLGGPPAPPAGHAAAAIQPLSYKAYVAANCYQALAALPQVDPKRVGVVGLSYGGKWAMFASCLYEKFAAGVWSDGGIVFDEKRPNVNYWEPWYLGRGPQPPRKPGVPNETNPRTGPYRTMIEAGRDLHELHALMAPRPFLVSGGSEDPPERWQALNHTVAVNALLGYRDRVAMTNRKTHRPDDEANEKVYQFFEYFLKHGKALEKP